MTAATATPGGDKATYTIAEFAQVMDVHPVTARRWVKRGLVAYETTPTGRIRIPRSAAEASITVHDTSDSKAA